MYHTIETLSIETNANNGIDGIMKRDVANIHVFAFGIVFTGIAYNRI